MQDDISVVNLDDKLLFIGFSMCFLCQLAVSSFYLCRDGIPSYKIYTTNRYVVIDKKVKGQVFGSTGVKQVKMLQFCWQWSQNARLVNIFQIQNSLSYVVCFINIVTE